MLQHVINETSRSALNHDAHDCRLASGHTVRQWFQDHPDARIFLSQKDLFDFIDGEEGGNDSWAGEVYLPCCLEAAAPLAPPKRRRLDLEPDAVGQRTQTRFFAAMTVARAAGLFHCAVQGHFADEGGLHLYEIIRENRPCQKAYFDLERPLSYVADKGDCSPWRTVRRSSFRCCRTACDVAPTFTGCSTVVFVRELQAFALSYFGRVLKDENIIVLDSTPAASKQSSHVLVDCGAPFENNAAVGVFAAAFVDFLYGRAQKDRSVHEALFYHGDPALIEDDAVANAATVVTGWELRCAVDLGVYTRNRMFRTIGSCKLGKTAVLELSGDWPSATRYCSASQALFRACLVSLLDARWWSIEEFIRLDSPNKQSPASVCRLATCSNSRTAADCASLPNDLDKFVVSLANEGGPPVAYIQARRSRPGDSWLIAIGGRRYCRNVGRDHKSNGVFYTVAGSHGSHTIVQRCFDPDCTGYRSRHWTWPPGSAPKSDAALPQVAGPVPLALIDAQRTIDVFQSACSPFSKRRAFSSSLAETPGPPPA